MLRWLRRQLALKLPEDCESRAEHAEAFDSAVLWLDMCIGFFYLSRAGEYMSSGGVDEEKCLRGADVALKDGDGGPAGPRPGDAEQAIIQYRKTKADQQAFGSCRGHYRAQDAELCPVEAFELLRAFAPERFRAGPESEKPLLRWRSGRVLKREDAQAALQRAAEAEGLPAARFKTHSLRIGGASALWHACGEVEAVKRWGRWSSTAFHGYLWDAAEQSKGISAAMAADNATLHHT